MILLGNIALCLAFLIGLWGTITGFVGGVQGRADLQHSARHASFALFGALLVAVISLELAIFRHDFSLEYVAAYTSRNLPPPARRVVAARACRALPPAPAFLPPRFHPGVRRAPREPQPADVLSVVGAV